MLAAVDRYAPGAQSASMLEQAIRVAVNVEFAFHWYSRAAELRDVDSAASVRKTYANSAEVEKSNAKASEWLRNAKARIPMSLSSRPS